MDSLTNNNYPKSNKDIVKQMPSSKVRVTMQKLQIDILEQIDDRLTEMLGEVIREVELAETSSQETAIVENINHKNRTKSEKPGRLPEKLFLSRNSLLTDLFEVNHGRAIYNILVAILMILFLNAAIDDMVVGKLNLGLNFIRWCFGELHTASVIWLCMASCTFTVYVLFHAWADQRTKLTPNSWGLKAWDYFWLVALIVYQACFLYFPARSIIRGRLPPVTAIAVLMEQIRIIMKSHSFVRSNAPRALSYKPHQTPAAMLCPGFSHFLYFFFCPSLVYRDNYPRTKSVRWRFVAMNYLHVIGTIFFMSFLFERYLVPSHRDYGKKPASTEDRIALVFGAMLPSMLALSCGFYCLLHAWMNASAELLRFADRMFYQDWWNAKSYSSYHRKWNVVIHDWLYTYIYKDMCELFCPKQRFVPMVTVFTVSAIVHEYILAFTLGFFYPVMLVIFGVIGLSFVVVTSDKNKGGNVFVWLTQFIGLGLMASLYFMEWYSRINCVQTLDDFSDFFVPRSWNCIPIQHN